MYGGQADPSALSRLRDDLLLENYIPALGGVELRALPGARRRGLFTTRAFRRGEVILAEAPCLWQEGGPSGPLHCPSHTPDELDGLLYQLAPFYCSPAAAPGGDGAAPGAAAAAAAPPPPSPLPPALARADLAARVLQENSFGVGAVAEGSEGSAYGQGAQGRAVYPAVALANHSCLPSARASQEGGALPLAPSEEAEGGGGGGGGGGGAPRRLLEARRDLAAGEEVTLSYVPVTWMRGPRRRALEATWGFSCACPRCSAAQDDTIVLRAGAGAGGGGGGGGEEEGSGLVEALCAPGRPRELLQRLTQHPTHALEDVRLFLTLVRLHQAFAPAPALREEVRGLIEAAAAGMPYIALEEIL